MESLVYFVYCFVCILGGIIVAALAAFLWGSTTLTSKATQPGQKSLWLPATLTIVGGLVLLIIAYGAWKTNQSLNEFTIKGATQVASYTPEYFNADNEEVRPFIAALSDIDRESLGFTPIPGNARVEIQRTRPPATYDVMLHIYADTSRTIAFKKEGDSYRWVGEQEIHTGPNQYETVDGVFNEEIVISYETVYLGSAPSQNVIYVDYFGDDPRLTDKFELTLEDVQPILQEWRMIQ